MYCLALSDYIGCVSIVIIFNTAVQALGFLLITITRKLHLQFTFELEKTMTFIVLPNRASLKGRRKKEGIGLSYN